MARKKSLVIEILGNNKMGRAVRDAMQSLRRLGGFARSVGRGIGRAFKIAAAGVGALTAGIAYATKIYGEQEQADADLTAAIEKRGLAVDETVAKLKQEAAQLQQITIYGDEFTQTLQAMAINMGVAADETTDAVKAAMGLSKAYSIDLVGAMRLVTRARVGDTATLKRYGIVLDQNMNAEEKYQALVKIGLGNFRLVEDAAKTTSGRFAQLRNAIGDVVEQIGLSFSEGVGLNDMLTKLTGKAADFGTALATKLMPHFKEFKSIVEGLMAGGEDRSAAINSIKENWERALDIVEPKAIDMGEKVGLAIWAGFKKGATSIGGAASRRVREATAGSAGATAVSAFGGFAGSLADTMGTDQNILSQLKQAGVAGVLAGGSTAAGVQQHIGTPGNPMHIYQVNNPDAVTEE